MDVQHLTVPPAEAEKMLRKYKEHRAWQNPLDADIERIYQMIAKGKTIINVRGSIVTAGLATDALPKLAIARADGKRCFLQASRRSGTTMTIDEGDWPRANISASKRFRFEPGSFPGIAEGRHSAMVPHVPPDIRPKRGVQNYHILFEAVWRPEPPIDPYLVRRLGKTEFFMVLAAWDLTPIERAVMAAHMPARRN